MVDWLVRNAVVVDGMKNPSITGDIAIQEGLIFDVGDLGNNGA